MTSSLGLPPSSRVGECILHYFGLLGSLGVRYVNDVEQEVGLVQFSSVARNAATTIGDSF